MRQLFAPPAAAESTAACISFGHASVNRDCVKASTRHASEPAGRAVARPTARPSSVTAVDQAPPASVTALV